MSLEFLLEIGCEEIPAWMLPRARASLRELLERELQTHGLLQGAPVQVFSTPRRLVATCARLAGAEPTTEREVIGPPKSVAYDAAGKPTRAAESFARKLGLGVKELTLVETPKGSYVAGVARKLGRPAGVVLAELLPGLIPRIEFSRSMYWTSARGLRFIRPLRWLVALLGGRVVEFELEGVGSGRVTRGHRFLAGKPIRVKGWADYRRRLRVARVLVDPEERREKILRESRRLLAGLRLRVREDEKLLDLLVNLVEWPAVVRGEFSREFLDLPQEMLVTVMRHHQKYLSVEDRRGALAPYFLTVIDSHGDPTGEIRRNHQGVLAARFRDARFFWQADQRRPLADRVGLLERVVFESRLGSYAQKAERVCALAGWLGAQASVDGRRADIASLATAARLCKCDLTTEMVREFPELQGVMGGLYARAQGEPEAVSRAIYEHYRPAGPEDRLPQTLEGKLLSIADKLDSIVACFTAGLPPTGSRDPFGLRRAGSGIVRIVVEGGLRLGLRAAAREAVAIVKQAGLTVAPASEAGVERFLEERARHLFREGKRFAYDEVNAAFAAGWDDLVDVAARLEAIQRLRPTPDFEPVAVAFKRIRNILEQAGGPSRDTQPIDNNLIEAGAERELYDRFLQLRPKVAALREKHRYQEALRHIASLRPQVDRYFDTVLVMAKDEALRANRLALLAQVLKEFSTVADFSEIVVGPKKGD
ncbi:MAG: glycine--tRNA ligase subunit beta [Terriglobia bacterium]